uniref:Uncharacterized protein n=1 Tax=Anguilla anguilla TaxID=7936 RepID=A0A0E9SU65_ANGAN
MAKMFSFRFVTKSLYFVSFLTFHFSFSISGPCFRKG